MIRMSSARVTPVGVVLAISLARTNGESLVPRLLGLRLSRGCASRRPDLYVFESRDVYNRLERLRPFRDQTTRLPPGGRRCGWTPQRVCTWPAFPPTPMLSSRLDRSRGHERQRHHRSSDPGDRGDSGSRVLALTAPIDGIVVIANLVVNGELRPIREGDIVAAGQTFLTIVDPGSMMLNANVNQVDAERLSLGMRATIQLDAYPGWKNSGTIIGFGAMARISRFRRTFVGEIPVRLRISGRDPRLLPDLTGSAEIRLNAAPLMVRSPLQPSETAAGN
jgi:hypothetical protein